MFIKNLKLKNFRNYSEESLDFINGINILTGQNAQGKTNVAEAVFFLCTGYSPRANKDKLVIKHGESEAEIEGLAHGNYGESSVKIRFYGDENKAISVNGQKVSKIGELMGNICSVFFNPSELKLVQEAPEDRRRFLNISLCQMSKSYFYALNRYNKILSQRNNLLKNPDRDMVLDTLSVWDESLAKEAGVIIKQRLDFINQISPIAEEKHALLSCGKETLKINTESDYSGSQEEISKKMLFELKNALEKDLKLGFTTVGPHRDDLKFTLNGTDAKLFASQGQQRSIALSLKLSETEIFKNRFNEYPILILDDVLSELDKERKVQLVGAVKDIQTIFTTTEYSPSLFKGQTVNKFVIANGSVKRKKTK